MPIKVMTPTKDQINELRNRFQRKLQQEPPQVPFHPVDMKRVLDEDLWLSRFLELYDLDQDTAFEKLWGTCIWRQEYGAYDLNEQSLRNEYLTDGVIFSRNADVDEKPLLIFRTKFHTKGSKDMNEVIKVVVYWIERLQRDKHLQKMTIIFDMSNTGLSNMDLDFVRRIIEVFKLYYPNCLNYILVYEMAWVLNAAFKLIKGMLPAKALEILKVISKKEINMYIDKDNCLKDWGGSDDYVFKFVPEIRRTTSTAGTANGLKPLKGEGAISSSSRENGTDKKVHFANGSPMRMAPPPVYDTYEGDVHEIPRDKIFDEAPTSEMIRIAPIMSIAFAREPNAETNVEITCTHKNAITFKIQTTSPEKFRVRPRCGVLYPGDTISIGILLKGELRLAEGSKDKFLVMCTPFTTGDDASPTNLAELWKKKPANALDVEQHRLCCTYDSPDGRNGYSRTGDSEVTGNKRDVTDLTKMAKALERQLRFTQIMQAITLIFLLILAGAVLYLLKLQLGSIEQTCDEFGQNCIAGRPRL